MAQKSQPRFEWSLFVLALTLIGIPIALIHPSNLNQDTYQYLGVANGYLAADHWHVRDVHTVGPILPGVLAAIKALLPETYRLNPNADVFIVKALAFACDVTLSLAGWAYWRGRGLSARGFAIGLGLILFALPHEKDVYSLNGELVCVALLGGFIALASGPKLDRRKHALLAVVALMVVYTKVQAILLLALCYLTVVDRAERRKALQYLAVGLLLAETVLYFAGGGWIAKARPLLQYVTQGQLSGATEMSGSGGIYDSIASHFAHLWWCLSNAAWYFPVLGFVVLAGFRSRGGAIPDRWSFLGWLVVTVFTIYLPGRPYLHYLLFCIPIILLYVPRVVGELPLQAPRGPLAAAVLVGLIAVKFCGLMPSRSFFAGDRIWGIFPAQWITSEAMAVKRALVLRRGDSIFVHGWDFRFYSYFGKPALGPELGFVEQGSMTKEIYLRQLLALHPTYIFDVVNHSGLVREPQLALMSVPSWAQAMQAGYERVYDQDGLVVYRAVKVAMLPIRRGPSTLVSSPASRS